MPDLDWHAFARAVPEPGDRVLCLAPPGELFEVGQASIERVGATGRVCALVVGDPYLQGAVPARLEVHDGDPARPHNVRGPFDVVLVWGSTPFLSTLPALLAPVRDALRPGGKLALDVPAYGFCAVLQASDPRAAEWSLPSADELRGELAELGFRDIEVTPHTELAEYGTLAEMAEALARPFPLAFEGRDGEELLEEIRANLVRGFEGADELSLARRKLRGSALR